MLEYGPIAGCDCSHVNPISGFSVPSWGGAEQFFMDAWAAHMGYSPENVFTHWYPVEHTSAAVNGDANDALAWFNHFNIAIRAEIATGNAPAEAPAALDAILAGYAAWQRSPQAMADAAQQAAEDAEALAAKNNLPPPPPQTQQASGSYLPWILGGGGLVAVVLIAKKRR